MIDHHPDHRPEQVRFYRVQLGHAAVTVRGRSQQEALESGRRQLSLELPRLWDVIQNLDEHRFKVELQN